jgi:transposase
LIVEKLLKLVGLNQRIQILSLLLKKKKKEARLANDKAFHALCQALSPSEFTKISNCGTALEA